METLGGLGPHPNIVSLVRVCTVGSMCLILFMFIFQKYSFLPFDLDPMYVVMEYMCHGDLLGFLRASRGHHGMYHISPGTRYQPPTLNLCSRDLLNVATKIANGMRYLSDRKVLLHILLVFMLYSFTFHIHCYFAFRSCIVHCVLRMF